MNVQFNLLQNTMSGQLQEILDYMQQSDSKKGEVIEYKNLEEQKIRA